jgi:sentrin-specific protease 7
MKIEENDKELDSQVEESWECSYTYQAEKTIAIKYYDFIKLHQHNFVNDTIINFFLRFIENELLPKDSVRTISIFNTYFSAKLVPYEKLANLNDKDHQGIYQLYMQAHS